MAGPRIPDRDEYRRQWSQLSFSDRRRIVRAVNKGDALENRKEAALAVRSAQGQKKFWSKAWLLGPLGGLITISQGWEVYVVNALLLTAVMGAMSFFWYRRADRAESVNLAVLQGGRGKKKGGGGDKSGRRRKGGGHLPG